MTRTTPRAVVALVVTTLAVLAGALQPVAAYEHKDWGKTASFDRWIRPGCHEYNYRYVVDPPSDDWAAEIFLVDRTGEKIASHALDVDVNPARGKRQWTLCRPTIKPGRFKIKMRVTWQTSIIEINKGWVKPSYFRLEPKRR
ncbi:hypothetical protein [Nocardioides sp. SYSU DS0663]|uniref:hypothetical protein n=1 Tax=Nocardioides sp. SYSU DS0663 TaxID=3416445 RepID=UPI003F4CA1F0